MKKIRFSVTDDQFRIIQFEAQAKGLKHSAFAKMTVFNYIAKYPCKGLLKDFQAWIESNK